MTTLDISNPEVFQRVFKHLSKLAKIRMTFSALGGKTWMHEQLSIECTLVAIGIETDEVVQQQVLIDNEDY